MRKSVLVLMLAAFVLFGMSTICSATDKEGLDIGVVVERLNPGMFHVKLENGHIVLASVSSKMRQDPMRIQPEMKVKVQLSPYDQNRGRIVYLFNVPNGGYSGPINPHIPGRPD